MARNQNRGRSRHAGLIDVPVSEPKPLVTDARLPFRPEKRVAPLVAKPIGRSCGISDDRCDIMVTDYGVLVFADHFTLEQSPFVPEALSLEHKNSHQRKDCDDGDSPSDEAVRGPVRGFSRWGCDKDSNFGSASVCVMGPTPS